MACVCAVLEKVFSVWRDNEQIRVLVGVLGQFPGCAFIGLLFALITILVMPPWDSSAYYPGATEAMMQRVFDVSIFVENAYFILTFIPNISIIARRIRDAGHTPWWMLIVLLPPA